MIFVFVTACGLPPSEQLMPSLQYNKNIGVHTHKNANLYWQTGMQLEAIQPSNVYGGDPLAAMIGTAIDSQIRKNNPGRFTYTYGGAQQAVFITSLKNILMEQRVFNNVKIITSEKASNPNDVLIKLNFKTTRVSGPEEQYAITLTAEMTIKAVGKKTFSRIYSVHNSPVEDVWSGRSFKMQQTEVSEKLLKQLLNGIAEWHQNS